MSQSKFTRESITKQLSTEFGIAYSVVYKKIDKILEIWSNEMINTDISINYIGSFKINKKNERIGRNPKTKEEHLIKSRKVISFKKSNKLVL
ncbi:HU family DNA-binding protein [Alphaproteobacteria bacterium]|nr:HU family DNA-binding protein [Alphaproteobacteria bacterium]